ncbi:hypothetical protein [Alishewanella longhuensis]
MISIFGKTPVEHIRFIGGFGEIFWLTQQEWQQPGRPGKSSR